MPPTANKGQIEIKAMNKSETQSAPVLNAAAVLVKKPGALSDGLKPAED